MGKVTGAKNKLIHKIALLKTKGFFDIFGSSILSKVVILLGGIILVRVFTQEDYGTYSYIINSYATLGLLNDFGYNVTAMQFCSEKHNQKDECNAYFMFTFKRMLMFSSITGLLIFLSPYFFPFDTKEAAELTRILCLLPIISNINAMLLTNLRVKLENRKFASINFFSTISHYVLIVPIAFEFQVIGAVISNYLIQISILIYSLLVSKKLLEFKWKTRIFEKKEKRYIFKYAVTLQAVNTVGGALLILDIFCVGLLVQSMTDIALYKAATIIPSALIFVQHSILLFVIPLFSRNITNKKWVKKNFKILMAASIGINGIIAVSVMLLSSFVLNILFGVEYMEAQPVMIILLINYMIYASFSKTIGAILATQRKIKINLAVSIISLALNLALNFILIPQIGIIGAAIGTLATSVLTGSLYSYSIIRFFNKNDDTIHRERV